MKTPPLLCAALTTSLIFFVLTDSHASLAALWRFDVTGTNQADSTLNGNTAQSINGAAWVLDGTRSSGTMSFDGLDDFLQVADSASLSITGDMTISLWFNLTALGGVNQWRGLVNKDAAGVNLPAPYQFWLNQGSPGLAAFGRGDGTNQDFAFSTGGPSTGVWEHWAASQSGTTVTIYRNGLPVALSDSSVSTPTADQNGPLIIGDRPGAQDMSFFGRMDDVAVFNHALTQTEVQTIMTGDYTAYGVPEPGSLALAVLGLGLVAGRRRRL